MAEAPMLAFDAVAKSYGGQSALSGVSLAIDRGGFVALVGASGSGKTTLLKTVNRLVEPDRGVVRIEGGAVRDLPVTELRRRIGYVFQGIGLFPHMNVAENIGIVPRLTGSSQPGRVEELLDLVALPRDFAARYPQALSGGQAQRVGVARALAAEPRIMLMDEPFGALDPVTRDELGRAYRALHDRLGLTTIMVTHDMAEALLLADRVIVMRAGEVVADEAPAALVKGHADPAVAEMIAVPRRQADRLAALERGA